MICYADFEFDIEKETSINLLMDLIKILLNILYLLMLWATHVNLIYVTYYIISNTGSFGSSLTSPLGFQAFGLTSQAQTIARHSLP